MHDFSKNAATMWVQPWGHLGQRETLSEMQCRGHSPERRNLTLRTGCGASWDTHGKGRLREGSGEGKANNVQVGGGVHTAGLLWIVDGPRICSVGLSLTIGEISLLTQAKNPSAGRAKATSRMHRTHMFLVSLAPGAGWAPQFRRSRHDPSH